MNIMRIKSFVIAALMAVVGCAAAYAQDISTLTQDQAREIVSMLCGQMNTTVSPESMQDATGISGMSVRAGVEDDKRVHLTYVVPGYNLTDTPENRAFTELLISSGGQSMTAAQVDMITAIFDRAGYDIRITYTDGKDHVCNIDLTPSRLGSLWLCDYAAAGLDRDMVRRGLLDSFAEAGKNRDDETDEAEYRFSVSDEWIDVEIIFKSDEVAKNISPQIFQNELLKEYSSMPVIAKMAGALATSEDYLGIKGLRISYGSKSTPKRTFTMSWYTLLNN